MGIILWIVLGGVAGWVASMIMNTDDRQGIIFNIVVGIIGASLGGFILNFFGQIGVSGFNFYSLLVAILGAVALLWIVKMLTGE
jgi:uncharacterized membrane protein YeaQ/YmgE (transglycosylase-associated protein family)